MTGGHHCGPQRLLRDWSICDGKWIKVFNKEEVTGILWMCIITWWMCIITWWHSGQEDKGDLEMPSKRSRRNTELEEVPFKYQDRWKKHSLRVAGHWIMLPGKCSQLALLKPISAGSRTRFSPEVPFSLRHLVILLDYTHDHCSVKGMALCQLKRNFWDEV